MNYLYLRYVLSSNRKTGGQQSQNPDFPNWFWYFKSEYWILNEDLALRNINTCRLPVECQLQPLIQISFPRTSREGSRFAFHFRLARGLGVHYRYPLPRTGDVRKCSFTRRKTYLHHKDVTKISNKADTTEDITQLQSRSNIWGLYIYNN